MDNPTFFSGRYSNKIMRQAILFFFLLTGVAVEAFLPQISHHSRPAATLFMSTEVSVKDITSDAEKRMGKSINSVKTNLSTIRTGRASSNMLDRVTVDYYGACWAVRDVSLLLRRWTIFFVFLFPLSHAHTRWVLFNEHFIQVPKLP